MKHAFFYARKRESDLPNRVEVYGFLSSGRTLYSPNETELSQRWRDRAWPTR